MALITIPSTPARGISQTYQLNTTDLIALVTQPFFKNIANWNRVILTYVSAVSNEICLIPLIPDGNETISGQGFFAELARRRFILANISIYDQQYGRYRLERDQIPDVNNYTLVFSVDNSFFPLLAGFSNYQLGVSPDNLYISEESSTYYGSPSSFQAIVTTDTGQFPESINTKISNWKTSFFKIKEDKSKVWAIGSYGTAFMGYTLPPITVGPGYPANPQRLVEIDAATGNVTWLCDTKFSVNPNAGTYQFDGMVIDEASNTAIFIGLGVCSGYSISSNTELWNNSVSNYAGLRMEDFDAGHVVTFAYSYAGTSYPNGEILKINKLTGIPASFPSTPVLPGAPFVNGQWAISPDKSTIFIQYYNGQCFISKWEASTNSWVSPIDCGFGATSIGNMATSSDALYVTHQGQIKKFNYSIVRDLAFTVTNTTGELFVATNTNVYYVKTGGVISKVNASNGSEDLLFLGFILGTECRLIEIVDNLLSAHGLAYRGQAGNYPQVFAQVINIKTPLTTKFAKGIATIDKSTRELTSIVSNIDPIVGAECPHPLLSSPLVPNKLFLRKWTGTGSNDYLYVVGATTGVQDSGWPTFAYQSMECMFISGEWLYVARTGAVGSTWAITDSAGSYNLPTILCRINLNTKLIDQSFQPSFAENFTGGLGRTVFISSSENYIYTNVIRGNDIIPSQLMRVNLNSPASCEFITAASLGFAGSFNGRIMAYQISSNNIILVADLPASNLQFFESPFQFDGKSYLKISNESLLTIDPSQPTTTDIFRYVTYNPTLNEIAGLISVPASFSYLAYYGVGDNSVTRTVPINQDPNISGSSMGTEVLGPTYETKIQSILADGIGYFVLFSQPCLINSRSVNGIVRMEPFGTPNNGEEV
jgi:hypothetical protein